MLSNFDPSVNSYDMFSLHGFKTNGTQDRTIEDAPAIYNGRFLLRELALFSSANVPNLLPLIFIIFSGRLMIPYVARFFVFGSFFPRDWDSILFCLAELLLTFTIAVPNYFFVLAGLIDFYRRLIMINGCSALINPFKSNLSIKYRLLPSINPCCKQSIHSWLMLRLCVMDYGRKYLNRIFIYESVFFGGYLFFIIVLLLNFFGLLSFKLSLAAQLYILYDTFVVLTVVLAMLGIGAIINS